jgi:type I restriction enzyme S subunit
MKTLTGLLAELCPEGVQYESVTNVAKYVRGLTYAKDKESASGRIKVLRSNNINQSQNVLNLTDVKTLDDSVKVRDHQKLWKGDILMSAASGSRLHVGKVAYTWEDMDYYFGGFMAVWRTHERMLPRFLFHILTSSNFSNYLDSAISSSTINNLSESILRAYAVPVPPIEVQREIVRILDKFTQLEAELEAELEARKTQYAEFRKKTFDFSGVSNVSWEEIGAVCSTFSGAFVKKTKQDESFEYPVFNGGSTATGFYSDYNSPENSIAISARGSIGAVNWVPTKFWAGNSCHVVLATDPRLKNRFLYHYLKFHEPSLYALRAVGSIPALNLKPLLKFEVPLPPVDLQEQISFVLDKFEALINDITIGLPAEISTRRQQYEHYRTKLLSFKELDVA